MCFPLFELDYNDIPKIDHNIVHFCKILNRDVEIDHYKNQLVTFDNKSFHYEVTGHNEAGDCTYWYNNYTKTTQYREYDTHGNQIFTWDNDFDFATFTTWNHRNQKVTVTTGNTIVTYIYNMNHNLKQTITLDTLTGTVKICEEDGQDIK